MSSSPTTLRIPLGASRPRQGSVGYLVRSAVLLIAVLAVLGGWHGTIVAQEGAFAFEIRGGGVLPMGSFRSGSGEWAGRTRAGSSFGMGFTFPAPGPFGAFLGFGQRRFDCRGSVCADGAEWISTGFDVALRLVLGDRRVRPWLKGGFHSHRLEVSLRGPGGEPDETRSEGGSGFEIGGGLLVAIAERMSLSPGIHYGSGEVPFSGRSALRLEYLVADLGLVLGF
jgi:hypothetical protein